jgi:protein O-GlcNAc transferase
VQLYGEGNLAAAQAAAEEVLQYDPGQHRAWNVLGAIAAAGEKNRLAAQHFERAVALQPDNADYLNNCGEAYRRDRKFDEAMANCRAAIAINPRHAGAHYNLALCLHAIGDVGESWNAYTNALKLRPDFRIARSGFLFLLCHHPNIDAETVFAEHRRWGELHAGGITPMSLPPRSNPGLDGKLRVGYVSADFRRHALSCFIEPLLAHHDRSRFDVFCYSNNRKTDEMTDRLRAYASHWRDIAGMSDEAAARLVSDDKIDILIDLSGHTARSRLLMFARKPAPVQIAYVGYLNTTGLRAMDFRISDYRADPPGIADALHTETILRMPDTQWCYRPPPDAPEITPLPALQRGFVTFGSLHRLTKVNPDVIELWARLLARQPGSELLIAGVPAGSTRQRICGQFASFGISAGRLHLFDRINFDDYMRLYEKIDIGLDAFPYNGATTTCESLWMGVPIVTLGGRYAAARSGVSLLTSVGLPELIADTPEQFVEIAGNLAGNPKRLAELRSGLRDRMTRSLLMDEPAFARAFEGLLRSAYSASAGRT